MAKKAVLIGAGKIGRGFLGDILYHAGYELTFLVHSPAQTQQMREQGYYTIFQTSEATGEMRKVRIDGYQAYCTVTEQEQCAKAIAQADYATVHIYPNACADVGHLIGEGIRLRVKNGVQKTLDVLMCVNFFGSDEMIKKFILERLQTDEERAYLEEKVGLVRTLTYRGGNGATPEMLAEDPIAVAASDYPYLPVDAEAFRGELPEGIQIRKLDRFTGHLTAKLWGINLWHCTLAAYTQFAGHELLWKGASQPYIRACVDAAREESNFAIKAEFGFTEEDLKLSVRTQETPEQQWERSVNPEDTDTVYRVAADPIRKLQKQERLVGPALACLRHGKLPYFIARSIALMCFFHNDADASAVELQEYIAKNGIEAALEKYCGLSDAQEQEAQLRQLVLGHYRELLASKA